VADAIAARPHACGDLVLRLARGAIDRWRGRPHASKRLAALTDVSARTPERWLSGAVDPDLAASLALIVADPAARHEFWAELDLIVRAMDAADQARKALHEASDHHGGLLGRHDPIHVGAGHERDRRAPVGPRDAVGGTPVVQAARNGGMTHGMD